MIESIKVVFCNIRSYRSSEDLLRCWLESKDSPDLLILAEANLKEAARNSLSSRTHSILFLPSHEHASNSRTKKKTADGGGFLLFIKRHISYSYLSKYSNNFLAEGLSMKLADANKNASIHCVKIKAGKNSSPFTILASYIPPQSWRNKVVHSKVINNVKKIIDQIIDEEDGTRLLLIGDLNMRSKLWDHSSSHLDSFVEERSKIFYNFLHRLDLKLLNTKFKNTAFQPTRPESKSVLDLAFATAELPILNFSLLHHHMYADHVPLQVIIQTASSARSASSLIGSRRYNSFSQVHNSKLLIEDELHRQLLYRKQVEHLQSLSTLLSSSISVSRSTARLKIENSLKELERVIHESCSLIVGKIPPRKKWRDWFDHPQVCKKKKEMMKKRDEIRRLYYHHKTKNYEQINFLLRLDRLKASLKIATDEYKLQAKEIKYKLMRHFHQSIKQETTATIDWSAIKKLKGSSMVSPLSVPDEHGNLPDDPFSSTNNLTAAFCRSNLPEREIPSSKQMHLNEKIRKLHQRTQTAVQKEMKAFKVLWEDKEVATLCKIGRGSKTATGPDEIPSDIITCMPLAAYSHLTNIYNCCFKYSILPSSWKQANVFAFLKDPRKSHDDPNNFRPISITSILIRTYERLIQTLILSKINVSSSSKSSSLYNYQFGFRNQRSTLNAIHTLVSGIQEELKLNKLRDVPAIFIDFKKAFDRVSHKALFLELSKQFKIHGLLLQWIITFLDRRQIRCTINGMQAKWHQLPSFGVPQGSVLSPLLFTLFINNCVKEMAKRFPVIRPILFADDLAMTPIPYSEWKTYKKSLSRSQRKKENIRRSLIKKHYEGALAYLSKWLLSVGMQANSEKTRTVIFTKTKKPENSSNQWFSKLQLDGFRIALADKYEYLGCIVTYNLSWELHIQGIIPKISRLAKLFAYLFVDKECCPASMLAIDLSKIFLLAKATYASEFWLLNEDRSVKTSNSIDRIMSLITLPIRAAFSLPKSTHRLGIYVDFGIPSLYAVARINAIRYLKRTLPAENCTLNPCSTLLQREALFDLAAEDVPPKKLNSMISYKKWTSLGARTRFLTSTLVYNSCKKFTNENARSPASSNNLLMAQPSSFWLARGSWANISATDFNDLQCIYTFHSWILQWASLYPGNARRTASPLTEVKRYAGTSLVYRFIGKNKILRTIAQLRSGRFKSNYYSLRRGLGVTDNEEGFCSHPPCRMSKLVDDAQHLLLYCPRFTELRQSCLLQLKKTAFGSNINQFTLAVLLGEVPAEHVDGLSKRLSKKNKKHCTEWYNCIERFYQSFLEIININS